MASRRSHSSSGSVEASHSVFAHRNPRDSTCLQCQNDNPLLQPRSTISLANNDFFGDQIVVGCQECSNSQMRSNSRNRRRTTSTSATSSPSRRISTTPEPLDSAEQPQSHSRRSRSRNSRNRSRQRRQRRRARRMAEAAANVTTASAAAHQSSDNNAANSGQTEVTPEQEAAKSQIRQWPHNLSFLFACLTCTVGMFNISRFAVLTIDFGVSFILQFLLLSLIFGIPLFTFHISLGQYLGSGVIDVWRISPIHQGIGIALMIAQGLYGIYNIAVISWLFVFFRDSFITAFDKYKWSLCFPGPKYERDCDKYNNTWLLESTIPDYYNGQVLLRVSPTYPQSFTGELRFQTLFHIIVIWMSVFIGLSKGLKSYGKVVYVFSALPLLGYLVFVVKVIGLLPLETFRAWISSSQLYQFVYNGDSWICAARECFFTWCILGATMSQLASHNKFKHKLFRDSTIVVLVTFLVLILSGISGIAIKNLINHSGYQIVASSFETEESYEFLMRRHYSGIVMRNGRDYYSGQDLIKVGDMLHQRSGSDLHGFNNKEHISFLAGVRIIREDRHPDKFSGYQVMRLATELVPALSAILGPRLFSPFWVVTFYFSMIVFGLAQQMALFHTVSSGLIAIRPDHFLQFEFSLIFMSCLLGLVLCFPFATEFGSFVVYFFDYTIGCGWWLMVLYVLQICAIFLIRGKPYSGIQVANALIGSPFCCGSWLATLLAFSWHVISPVGLIILTVVSFRWCRFYEMFDWTTHSGYLYLPAWVREIGAMMQLLPLLLVPFVAVVQSCRYFLNGQGPLHERINLLYRPTFEAQTNSRSNGARSNNRRRRRANNDNGVILTNYNTGSVNDPPPKYTPPPSYSTATGARIARFLRQSFRQSIRRFRGESVNESSANNPEGNVRGRQSRGKLSPELSFTSAASPPDYATVIIETERHTHNNSDYGSFNASQDLTLSSLVSSELTLVESRQSRSSELLGNRESEHATTSFNSSEKRSARSDDSDEYVSVANITVKNAEPFDSIVDGARALQQQASGASSEEASIYSLPSSSETDNALTEYTVVKEIKKSTLSDRQKRANNPPETEMDIYSAASTLSLGETIILSDGWLNHEQILPSLTTPNNTNTTTEEDEDSHNIVLTLDVDTSASVI